MMVDERVDERVDGKVSKMVFVTAVGWDNVTVVQSVVMWAV